MMAVIRWVAALASAPRDAMAADNLTTILYNWLIDF